MADETPQPEEGPSPEPALVPPESDPQGGTFEGLDAPRVNAIMALMSEPTMARAATMVGICERTLRRWMGEPAFKRAYHNARREAFGQAVGLTQRYAPVAVATLVKVMTDPTTPHGVRVAAAAVLLRFGREGIELDDLAERVEALEMTSERNRQGER